MRTIFCSLLILLFQSQAVLSQQEMTYAEKLGFPKGKKVVIFHVDDAGMSYESNEGAKKSIHGGVATSCSIMMPCPWAASFVKDAKIDPMDAGLHLTLTSERKHYRWPPLAGKTAVPGLVDEEGAMWSSVAEVVANASPDEVEIEIRAQIDRALSLGLKPTHMDSHMGTLFYHPPFLERYIKVGIEYGIPVMFPGGNNKLLGISMNNNLIKQLKKQGKYKEGMKLPNNPIMERAPVVAKQLWDAGLPVLDDLHTISGNWSPDHEVSDEELGGYKVEKCKELLRLMEPGLAMVIVHSNGDRNTFDRISGSGKSRYADMLAMTSPELQKFIEDEGIILTTWSEVMERRKKVK
ncbi:polysaccharide deacetylase family protein [uncultured Cyclobacterium sp.]|uniref:polysaccharide deacetylase family protein n=1 Tax=uncultured Cyclobacterium sp. TaxID=453820 RepID=UPI0030ECA496